jgi:hypothetical protein
MTTTEFAYSRDRLHELLNAEPNWDGCGGKPACPVAGKAVQAFLANIQAAKFEEPSLAMGGDGSIAVVWQCPHKGHYLSADFCDDKGYAFFVAEGDKLVCDGCSETSDVDPRLAQYLPMVKEEK